jgi:putative hydrolase of the HAD superfamily
MSCIKHFSFDLWYTLIKSNPNFKKERALYFYKHFNSKNKSLIEVENSFRKIDLMCNSINEKTGGNIEAEEMYLMVLYELNEDNQSFELLDLKELYKYLEKLFFNYSPQIFDNQTLNSLEEIKQKPGTTLSILSNTAFIKGQTLRHLLNNLNVSHYFDFQIYSDENKISKPNQEIFRLLVNNARKLHTRYMLGYNEIIHVGDNIKADINGANFFGIQSFLINSNGKSIQEINKI